MTGLVLWTTILVSTHSITLADTVPQKRYEVRYSRPLPIDLVDRVSALDLAGDPESLGSDGDGIGTPFGLRFDQSCKRALSQDDEKRKRQLITLKGVVSEAFNRILVCRANYPELDPWIRRWITMARRHRISCVNETSAQKNAGAWNNFGEHTTYPIDTFEKSTDGMGALTFKDGREIIALDSWTIDALIHEIFHATQANNRLDHNKIEFIPPMHKTNRKTNLDVVECNDDIAMDRVNLVASLCSGEDLSGGKQTALFELSDRMAHCPESKSCVGVFSHSVRDNISSLGDYLWDLIDPDPSGKLSFDQSRLLCARIRDRAQCEREVESFYGSSLRRENDRINFAVKISKKPEVRALAKRLRDRLAKITPSFANELPGEWINLDPRVKAEFEVLADDACFKAMFLRAPSGNYFLGGAPKRDDAFNGMSRFSKSNTLAGHIEFDLARRFPTVAASERSCQGSKTPDRVKAAIDKLYTLLDSDEVVMNTEGYYKIANNEFDEHVNKIGGGWFYAEVGPIMTQLIGKELIGETDRVLLRFHPYSKTFDCVGAGYTKQTAAELARQGLRKPASSKKSCP